MAEVYGQDTPRRLMNWQLFFMGCEETFRLGRGYEYMVSHYLFQKTRLQFRTV